MKSLEELERSIDQDPLALRLSMADVGPARRVTWDFQSKHARQHRFVAPRWRVAIALAALGLLAVATPVAATSGAVFVQALHQVRHWTVEHRPGLATPPAAPTGTPHALSPRIAPDPTPSSAGPGR